MQSLLQHLLDRRLGQHLDLPQMRAIPLLSPATIMTLLETCQSMQNLFLQSLNMPPHLVTSHPSPTSQLWQGLFTVAHTDVVLLVQRHPATVSTTVPHIGCCSMVTALLLYILMDHGQRVWSMQSQGHVTLYYRSTRMRSLCEHVKLGHLEKGPSCAVGHGVIFSQDNSAGWCCPECALTELPVGSVPRTTIQTVQ